MEFTPEQELLRNSVRAFATKEMPDGFAREWDIKGEPPLDTYQRFAEAGFMGVGIPERYGGQGGGILGGGHRAARAEPGHDVVRHHGL